MKAVIDTNVLLIANEQHEEVSPECVAECVRHLRAMQASGVTVIDAPAMATGRLELRWYLREQTVSRVRHRYGNVIAPAGTE
jgi:ABC-type ATPase involved in cell division